MSNYVFSFLHSIAILVWIDSHLWSLSPLEYRRPLPSSTHHRPWPTTMLSEWGNAASIVFWGVFCIGAWEQCWVVALIGFSLSSQLLSPPRAKETPSKRDWSAAAAPGCPPFPVDSWRRASLHVLSKCSSNLSCSTESSPDFGGFSKKASHSSPPLIFSPSLLSARRTSLTRLFTITISSSSSSSSSPWRTQTSLFQLLACHQSPWQRHSFHQTHVWSAVAAQSQKEVSSSLKIKI